MIRGLYTSASGMILCNQQSEVMEDNIENLRNPGYRQASERVTSFPRLLVSRIATDNSQNQEKTALGIMGTGVYADRKYYSPEPGDLRKTENKTDLALNSAGYFVIQTIDGERYTRNGHFQLDPAGMLRTAGGNMVLGENGPIGPLPQKFEISLNGTVTDSETHEIIDRLRIVEIPALDLQKEGLNNLYRSESEPVEANWEDVRIHQGYVEESNVNLDAQMVKMVQVSRAYSANQKMVQINDDLLKKAANEIGKV